MLRRRNAEYVTHVTLIHAAMVSVIGGKSGAKAFKEAVEELTED